MKQIEIFVTYRRVYGMPVIYPACPNAKLLAQLAGTKTFSPRMIPIITRLGYDVTEREEEQTQ
jgi:hypothetical protein